MEELINGIIKIDGETIGPQYRFDDFKKSDFYNGQAGVRIIYLEGIKQIFGRNFIVSLFFKDGKIYIVSLICCDNEYEPEQEENRKILHDYILNEMGIEKEKIYQWGKISSVYDPKSNISSINV